MPEQRSTPTGSEVQSGSERNREDDLKGQDSPQQGQKLLQLLGLDETVFFVVLPEVDKPVILRGGLDVLNGHADVGDVFFTVNTMKPGLPAERRGTSADVVRGNAVWADLDVKGEGTFASVEDAEAFAFEVGTVIGHMPITVHSGGGVHAYWPIIDGGDVKLYRQVLAAFGRLVRGMAADRGVSVDSVFDPARVLRLPGTWNRKPTYPEPVPCVLGDVEDADGAVEIAELCERLLELGWRLLPEDAEVIGAPVLTVGDWDRWPAETTTYWRGIVEAWEAGDGPRAGEGRHPWLLGRVVRVHAACRAGRIARRDVARVEAGLHKAFASALSTHTPQRREGRFEFADAWTWGQRRVESMSDERVEQEQIGETPKVKENAVLIDDERDEPDDDVMVDPATGEVLDPEDLWSRRESLLAIRHAAGYRIVSPWGLLAVQLARAIHAIPWKVQYLSSLGVGSLNSATMLVGTTGANKGRTVRTAAEFLTIAEHGIEVPFRTVEPGSGEAMVTEYAYMDKKAAGGPTLVWRTALTPDRAASFSFSEVGKLTKLGNRSGATVFEYLKAAITGDPFGRTLASGEGVCLAPDTYRMTLLIQAQPSRLGEVLTGDEAAGGFPGRFAWFAVGDTGEQKRRLKEWANDLGEPRRHTVQLYGAWPARIRSTPAMDAWHEEQQYRDDIPEIESHEAMVRVKIAAGLMVLDGRKELDDEDWELSELVMAHSRRVRRECLAAIAEAGRKANVDIGKKRAIQSVAQAEAADEENLRALAVRFYKVVANHEAKRAHGDRGCPNSCLKTGDLSDGQRAVGLERAREFAKNRGWVKHDVESSAPQGGGSPRNSWTTGTSAPK